MKEYSPPHDLLQNSKSLFYKMVQQLGKAKAAALTETAKQVSPLWGVVIKIYLHSSLLTQALCVLFNHTPPETKIHEWIFTCCRWKPGLLGLCRSSGDGVRMCACTCTWERFWIGLGTHLDSGFRFSQSTGHPFCRPFTFILIGAQHICDTSSVKEYPGNLRV